MQLPVIIPEPCQEQWDNMQARSNGRHCNACQKTVVDFTGWEADDILAYLKGNKQTCGRFTADQLQMQEPVVPRPTDFTWWQQIMSSALSHMGKIAAAVMLFFHLASCDTTSEVVENKPVDQITTGKPLVAATQEDNDIMGGIAIMGDTIIPPAPPKPHPVPVKHPEPVLMGEPAVIIDSPVVTVSEPQPQIMGAPLLVIPRQDSVQTVQKE